MPDQDITCSDCAASFVFSEGEQEFYASKNLSNPQRCKSCRQARRSANQQEREMHDAVCSECNAECQVPFKPRGDKPVLCRDCFAAQRNG